LGCIFESRDYQSRQVVASVWGEIEGASTLNRSLLDQFFVTATSDAKSVDSHLIVVIANELEDLIFVVDLSIREQEHPSLTCWESWGLQFHTELQRLKNLGAAKIWIEVVDSLQYIFQGFVVVLKDIAHSIKELACYPVHKLTPWTEA